MSRKKKKKKRSHRAQPPSKILTLLRRFPFCGLIQLTRIGFSFFYIKF